MILKPKIAYTKFIEQFTPLYQDEELEAQFSAIVESTAESLINFERDDSLDEVQKLVAFLRADEGFLGIILSIVNLSQEKFRRILSAERFAQRDFGTEWSITQLNSKIRSDEEFAVRIAKLFLESQSNETLSRQVAEFYLRQIELPDDWENVIKDETVIKNLIRRKLSGRYSDAKGKAVERLVKKILTDFQNSYGVGFEHGQVIMVQKEVDFAVPDCTGPKVMIMVSYMETTSSNQTTRANEQNSMHQKIVGHNTRYPRDPLCLVNVIDGAGWLARRSDLQKLYNGCDYPLTIKMLDRLPSIISKFVPASKFTIRSRPQITEE